MLGTLFTAISVGWKLTWVGNNVAHYILIAWTCVDPIRCIHAFRWKFWQSYLHHTMLHPCIWFNILGTPYTHATICPCPIRIHHMHLRPCPYVPLCLCIPIISCMPIHVHAHKLPMTRHHAMLPPWFHSCHLLWVSPPYSPFELVVPHIRSHFLSLKKRRSMCLFWGRTFDIWPLSFKKKKVFKARMVGRRPCHHHHHHVFC